MSPIFLSPILKSDLESSPRLSDDLKVSVQLFDQVSDDLESEPFWFWGSMFFGRPTPSSLTASK